MLWSALLFGFLGSFHCIGMCGPIAFLLPVERSNTFKKIAQIIIYHTGRLLAYSSIGLLFGLAGKGFYLFGVQQQLAIFAGTLMILTILLPKRTFQKYNLSMPIFKIISKIKNGLGTALKKKTPDALLTIGLLNGFLPCGLVYMALFGALAAGNPWEGSLYMALFGLGTIPLMTSAIYIGNFLNMQLRQRIRKAIPVFVLFMGCLFIVRGLGLGIPYISPEPVMETVEAGYNCHATASVK